MKSAIVEEGSVADGDGHVSYAARRRNLACRPSALGRLTAHTKACRRRRLISLPNSAAQPDRTDPPSSRPKPSPPPGQPTMLDIRLDCRRES